jgi:hypothetical protein
VKASAAPFRSFLPSLKRRECANYFRHAGYHAGIVLFRIGLNDGWRAAAGASEFFRRLTSLSSFDVMPTRTVLASFSFRSRRKINVQQVQKAARQKPSGYGFDAGAPWIAAHSFIEAAVEVTQCAFLASCVAKAGPLGSELINS